MSSSILLTSDSLVNREQEQVKPVIVFLVKSLHNVDQNGGVFPPRGPDGYPFSSFEYFIFGNSQVNLILEHLVETLQAYLLSVLWTEDFGFVDTAVFTCCRHIFNSSLILIDFSLKNSIWFLLYDFWNLKKNRTSGSFGIFC